MTNATKAQAPERWPFYESWDGGDPWGSTISHLFGIAEAVYSVDGESWEEFSPGLHLPDPETDAYPDCLYVEGLQSGEIDRDALHHWYRVLLRYDGLLRHHGHNY